MFVSDGEMLQIGPLVAELKETDRDYESQLIQRDAITMNGLDPYEAEVLRNVLEKRVFFGDTAGVGRSTIRTLVKAGLAKEAGDHIKV